MPSLLPACLGLDCTLFALPNASGFGANASRKRGQGRRTDDDPARRTAGRDRGRRSRPHRRRRTIRPGLPIADPARDRTPAPFRDLAALCARRPAADHRHPLARHVRAALGACRRHPARRPRPCDAGGRAGAGPVHRGGRHALRPAGAGRRPCRGRGRDAGDPAAGVRALLVAEAELGERIIRALILRRVALLGSGGGGPVFIGAAASPAIARLQNFLDRNGQPHHLLDPGDRSRGARGGRALLPRPKRKCRWWWFPTARSFATRTRRHWRGRCTCCRRAARAADLRRRRGRRRAGGPRHRGLRGLGRTFGGGPRRPRLWRPGRGQRPDRELLRLSHRHLRRRPHRRAFVQAQKFGAEMLIPVDVTGIDCSRPRGLFGLRARGRRAAARADGGGGERGAPTAARRSSASPNSRAAASGTGRRRSRRGSAPDRRSCWSAAATRPARPPCSSRRTPAGCG